MKFSRYSIKHNKQRNTYTVYFPNSQNILKPADMEFRSFQEAVDYVGLAQAQHAWNSQRRRNTYNRNNMRRLRA